MLVDTLPWSRPMRPPMGRLCGRSPHGLRPRLRDRQQGFNKRLDHRSKRGETKPDIPEYCMRHAPLAFHKTIPCKYSGQSMQANFGPPTRASKTEMIKSWVIIKCVEEPPSVRRGMTRSNSLAAAASGSSKPGSCSPEPKRLAVGLSPMATSDSMARVGSVTNAPGSPSVRSCSTSGCLLAPV